MTRVSFGLHVFEEFVIEIKLALQRSIGHSSLALKPSAHLLYQFREFPGSLRQEGGPLSAEASIPCAARCCILLHLYSLSVVRCFVKFPTRRSRTSDAGFMRFHQQVTLSPLASLWCQTLREASRAGDDRRNSSCACVRQRTSCCSILRR